MIIDTSAIVAIVRQEQDGVRCLETVLQAPIRRVSAGNLLEIYVVIDGARDRSIRQRLHQILLELRLVIEPVTEAQVVIARTAYKTYGKGSGHGARLNYGDCFAYALARERNEPLLFIGKDFSQTDIISAI